MIKLLLKLTAVTVALAVAISAAGPVDAKKDREKKKRGTLVQMDAVKIEPLVQTMPIIGRLVARQAGVVASRIEAPVAVVKVYVGDNVKKDDVLAVLVSDRLKWKRELKVAEVAESKAKIATAKAKLALAKQELRRLERLRKSPAFSQARFEDKRLEVTSYQTSVAEAKAQLGSARANLRMVEVDLRYTLIRAPYNGVVTVRHTIAGAYLKEGQPVVTLVSDEDLEFEADVPSNRLSGLISGVEVDFELEDKSRHRAKVRAVVPEENPRTRTRTVRFTPTFNGTEMRFAANQTAILHLPVAKKRMVVTVHKDALVSSRGNQIVFVVEKRRARARKVHLGEAVGGRFEVLSGLEAGEMVVVRGNERLRDGKRVRIDGAAGGKSGGKSGGKTSGRSGGGS
jgi:RND family efflux transporter MFP subunit